MSQNTTTAQPRTVQTADRGKLDVRALVLLAMCVRHIIRGGRK